MDELELAAQVGILVRGHIGRNLVPGRVGRGEELWPLEAGNLNELSGGIRGTLRRPGGSRLPVILPAGRPASPPVAWLVVGSHSLVFLARSARSFSVEDSVPKCIS